MDKKKIIISLTTIPSRINLIEPVLDSLINQTIRPDMIYLNVPRRYNRFGICAQIPEFIQKKKIVKVFYLDKDYGPATKFIGSLLNPDISENDIVLVTDDDVIKLSHWASKLLLCHQPNKICCFEERKLGKEIIWGYLGFIFRKGIFDVKDMLKFFDKIKDNCYLVDDHWLTGYCHYKKIPIYNIPINRSHDVNKSGIKNVDSLVSISGDDNRWYVSERCRTDIKNKFDTEFPFWCCMGCCKKGIRKTIENFNDTGKTNYKRIIIFLIITVFAYCKLSRMNFIYYLITCIFIFGLEKLIKTNEKFSNQNNNESLIPKIVIQTYYRKEKIPDKVYLNIQKYAPGYEHIIFDDNECEDFLKKYFNPSILATFRKLKGAHKADLFRYCYLYKHGGVYIDIKTELIRPMDEVFNQNYTYSVLSIVKNTIYQGIIATPPKNPIFLKLIYFMVKLVDRTNEFPYIIFTYDFYQKIKKYCGEIPKSGLNTTDQTYPYYLFTERCSKNKEKCYDGLDRYGLCCYVYDGDEKMIKSRYSDFPW